MTYRLSIPPRREDYSAQFGQAARLSLRQSTLPRGRADLAERAIEARLSWRLGGTDLAGMLALISRLETTGEEIEIPLLLQDFTLRNYRCRLVPGSVQISQAIATRQTISATFEVDPLTDLFTPAIDEALMDMFEAYGDGALEIANLLAQLVNEDLPA